MYADTVTPAMRACIDETERRRTKQKAYNEANGIVPQTIQKDIHEIIEISMPDNRKGGEKKQMTRAQRQALIEKLRRSMKNAAKLLEFEYAAQLRDQIAELEQEEAKLKSTKHNEG